MNILLTGGAGYIGSHTAIELIEAKHSVVIVDNFVNSNPLVLRRIENITGKKIPIYCINIADVAKLDKVFCKHNIDAVIHFAGFKSMSESLQIPLKYYRNNIDTTLALLEIIKKHDVTKFIFSSSAAVYGYINDIQYIESMPVGHCSNPYAWTKLFIEQILKDVATVNPDFSVILLRYFNPAGAHTSGKIGENPNGIPNNLFSYISQVAIGKLAELKIFGNNYPTKDGTGVRDYIHVVDLAKGHIAALEYTNKHKGVEAINIGTGIGFSVLDIVKTFEKINKIKIPYQIIGRRAGDIAECYADTSKAISMLNWKAEKTLEDICCDTWYWQIQNPNGYEK
ncbi:MAG: UDP-glucose 4-epimerase GalE [Prevotellaceae bacterium]|jgi:UDP-glucose 4-epimerase|nr:UDP-glucose 4-epimerase GalE [Prevotellaceae bacterium]